MSVPEVTIKFSLVQEVLRKCGKLEAVTDRHFKGIDLELYVSIHEVLKAVMEMGMLPPLDMPDYFAEQAAISDASSSGPAAGSSGPAAGSSSRVLPPPPPPDARKRKKKTETDVEEGQDRRPEAKGAAKAHAFQTPRPPKARSQMASLARHVV